MSRLSITHTVDVHYVDEGPPDAGPALLFFNGATLPLAFWDPLVERLRGEFRCIRFDQRNAGKSTYKGAFSLPDVAADAAALAARLDVGDVVAVGHAWGGRAAQVFARDYPHLVKAMIICGTGGALPAATDPGTLATMRRAARTRDRKVWEDALHDTFCAAGYRIRDPQGFEAVCDLLWSAQPNTAAKWDERVAPSSAYWGTAKVPALLLYGDQDKNGTLENAHDLLAALPQAQLEVIPAAGHYVIREAVELVSTHMERFLRSLGST